LAPDLLFQILVVKDGYTPQFVNHVDPAPSGLQMKDASIATLLVFHIEGLKRHGYPLPQPMAQVSSVKVAA
jgi:hypothetical protein